jgi:hypothetical protein
MLVLLHSVLLSQQYVCPIVAEVPCSDLQRARIDCAAARHSCSELLLDCWFSGLIRDVDTLYSGLRVRPNQFKSAKHKAALLLPNPQACGSNVVAALSTKHEHWITQWRIGIGWVVEFDQFYLE